MIPLYKRHAGLDPSVIPDLIRDPAPHQARILSNGCRLGGRHDGKWLIKWISAQRQHDGKWLIKWISAQRQHDGNWLIKWISARRQHDG